MKLLTKDEIAELRGRDALGTPAPWRWNESESVVEGPVPVRITQVNEDDQGHLQIQAMDCPGALQVVVETDSGFYGPHGADRELIPAARNALPALLSEVERSRALLKRIEWSGGDEEPHGNGKRCPCCGEFEPLLAGEPGHKPGCELAALLGDPT